MPGLENTRLFLGLYRQAKNLESGGLILILWHNFHVLYTNRLFLFSLAVSVPQH